MRKLLLICLLLLVPAFAHARPFSAGGSLGLPGAIGGFASYWPTDDFSLDLRISTLSADAGVTAHVPLEEEHRLLFNATLGYGVRSVLEGDPILGAAVGYGFQSDWDVRVLVGLSGYGPTRNWNPASSVLVGHSL